LEIDPPGVGAWSIAPEAFPYSLQAKYAVGAKFSEAQVRAARQAFYALCTHIDHQLRVVIGTLREEALLGNTIICFTADHGDMLGNHGLWAKRLFYEESANVPMILVGAAGDGRVGYNWMDNRLVGWQDVMPTLLDLAGVPIPETVDGLSMVGEQKRSWLYGEIGEDGHATRMIHNGRYKLIYYPVGNYQQLFDLETDPDELIDLSRSPDHAEILAQLTQLLIGQLYGGDEAWVQASQLVGLPDREFVPGPNKGLSSQRGHHWPPPPRTDMPQIEWHHEAKKP
jgi:arylsulfatase A-like enzyme